MESLPVKLNEVVTQSKLTDSTEAQKIASGYAPFMSQLNDQMELLKGLEKGNSEHAVLAKRVRIDVGKICSAVDKKKKEDKDVILLKGRFVDALYNTVNGAGLITQGEAKEIEEHQQRIEAAKIEALRVDREALVSEVSEVVPGGLGTMDQSVFDAYLKGLQVAKDAEIAEKAKLEAEQIAKEKAERERIAAEDKKREEERQKVIAENERLLKEAKETARVAKIEQEKRDREESLRIAKEKKVEEERERLADVAIKKRAKIEAERIAKAQEERKVEFEARQKIQIETTARQKKLEDQLKAKEDQEAQRLADEKAKAQAELNKGDAAKVKDLIADLEALKTKYVFKSEKNRKMYSEIGILIDRTTGHINKQ